MRLFLDYSVNIEDSINHSTNKISLPGAKYVQYSTTVVTISINSQITKGRAGSGSINRWSQLHTQIEEIWVGCIKRTAIKSIQIIKSYQRQGNGIHHHALYLVLLYYYTLSQQQYSYCFIEVECRQYDLGHLVGYSICRCAVGGCKEQRTVSPLRLLGVPRETIAVHGKKVTVTVGAATRSKAGCQAAWVREYDYWVLGQFFSRGAWGKNKKREREVCKACVGFSITVAEKNRALFHFWSHEVPSAATPPRALKLKPRRENKKQAHSNDLVQSYRRY